MAKMNFLKKVLILNSENIRIKKNIVLYYKI